MALDGRKSLLAAAAKNAAEQIDGELQRIVELAPDEEKEASGRAAGRPAGTACGRADALAAQTLQRNFASFRTLFGRFISEGTTVDWSKISPPSPSMIRSYDRLAQCPAERASLLLDKLVVLKLNGGLGAGRHGTRAARERREADARPVRAGRPVQAPRWVVSAQRAPSKCATA